MQNLLISAELLLFCQNQRKGKEMLINNCCGFGAVLLLVCNSAEEVLGGSEGKAFVWCEWFDSPFTGCSAGNVHGAQSISAFLPAN